MLVSLSRRRSRVQIPSVPPNFAMFTAPKGYFHDRTILILVCANFFMLVLGVILALLRISRADTTYLVQYRSNLSLLSQNTIGDASSFYLTILILLSIVVISIFISMKTYLEKRSFSVIVLGKSLFIVLLSVIVSDALLRAVS